MSEADSADESVFRQGVADLRAWLDDQYDPLVAGYLDAVREGKDPVDLAGLADALSSVADEAESRYSKLLFKPDGSTIRVGLYVTETAGHWVAMSDLWSALADAHRASVGGHSG